MTASEATAIMPMQITPMMTLLWKSDLATLATLHAKLVGPRPAVEWHNIMTKQA
jgi:hypothetical protein